MKKLLLATAVAALSVSAANAAPTVYGKAFLTADYTDWSEGDYTGVSMSTDKDGNPVADANGKVAVSDTYKGKIKSSSDTKLNSNASRIGLKGAEGLTPNTDLVYQLEYRVDLDSDKQRNWESRDTYLGLANKQYGTFLAGRLTTIDDSINYANVTQGGVIGGDDVLASFGAARVNNAFAYVSPSYNGMNFMAMYGNDGDQDANSLPNGGWGVGVKYEPAAQPFRAGATYIHAKDVVDSAIRVSGAYDINPNLTVGALYQNTDYKLDDKENAFALSAEMKTATPWSTYGQVDMVTNVAGVTDAKQQRYTVGGKYAFNKATTGHVYAAYMNEDDIPTVDTRAVPTTVSPTGYVTDYDINSRDGFGIGAGLEYKF